VRKPGTASAHPRTQAYHERFRAKRPTTARAARPARRFRAQRPTPTRAATPAPRCRGRSAAAMRGRASQAAAAVLLLMLCVAVPAPAFALRGFDDMKGIVIPRCCVIPENPFVLRDPNEPRAGGFSGLAMDYLDKLSKKLGFTCGVIKEYDPPPDNPDFAGFNGFITNMEACAVNGDSSKCTCNLGVSAWALTSPRFGRIDYIVPFSGERFRMAARTSTVRDSASKSVFFISAFSTAVWLAIAGLAALHIFVTMMDKTFAPAADDPLSDRLRPGDSCLAVFRQHVMKNAIAYRLRHAF
jgi:hypothetical protein